MCLIRRILDLPELILVKFVLATKTSQQGCQTAFEFGSYEVRLNKPLQRLGRS